MELPPSPSPAQSHSSLAIRIRPRQSFVWILIYTFITRSIFTEYFTAEILITFASETESPAQYWQSGIEIESPCDNKILSLGVRWQLKSPPDAFIWRIFHCGAKKVGLSGLRELQQSQHHVVWLCRPAGSRHDDIQLFLNRYFNWKPALKPTNKLTECNNLNWN